MLSKILMTILFLKSLKKHNVKYLIVFGTRKIKKKNCE